VKWSEEVWERIDHAVHREFLRTSVAEKFLPHHRVDPHITTLPADTILSSINGPPLSIGGILAAAPARVGVGAAGPPPLLLNIDEAATTRLVEIWVEFSLTPQQVEQESKFKDAVHDDHSDQATHLAAHGFLEEHSGSGQHEHASQHGHSGHRMHHAQSTAVTLATRAANILSQAMDAILFQGQIATAGPLVTSGLVGNRGVPGDYGLLCVGPTPNSNLPPNQVVAVATTAPSFAIQTITILGATGGNFTLTYGGVATAAIPWSANNAVLVTNIVAALTVGVGGAAPLIPPANIAVTPGTLTNGLGTIQITFLGPAAATATPLTAASALVPAAPPAPAATVSVGFPPPRYVENTITAIDTAYSRLQAEGHYGPYAAVLYFYPFADSYSPLPTTLILPSDRIRPLMTEGFFGTAALPGIPNPVIPAAAGPLPPIPYPTNPSTQSMGLVVSTGGNSMDLVIGQAPITAFSQVDQFGNLLLRLFTRFALRLKDTSAVIRLEFQ